MVADNVCMARFLDVILSNVLLLCIYNSKKKFQSIIKELFAKHISFLG